MKIHSYHGYSIQLKRDFPKGGALIDGKIITRGWVVIKNSCNIMPGATWFRSITKAKHAIDVFIKSGGDADLFWELMQPFEYTHIGQVASIEKGEIEKGRFKAIIKNYRVAQLITSSAPDTLV